MICDPPMAEAYMGRKKLGEVVAFVIVERSLFSFVLPEVEVLC